MNRCLSCNALMTKEEIVCADCGNAVANPNRLNFPRLLNRVLTFLFYLAVGMTVASFMFPHGLNTMICGALAVALLFVKRSAKDAAEKIAQE